MGIPDFLKRVLESSGRPCDLRDYANGLVSRKRPLRVGLDISTWIYTGAYAYGDMLGDERHLSNYGRATLMEQQQQQQTNENAVAEVHVSEEVVQKFLDACTKHVLHRLQSLQETTGADILVVLDGMAPPIKKREVLRRRQERQEQETLRDQPVDPHQSPTHINHVRTKANRRAGAGKYHGQILTQLMEALREAKQPFLVAPYEADAQLAYLSEMGYLDLVISEDSDLVAHGTKAVLFKLTLDPPQGKLLKYSDLGAGEHWNLASFTPVMMTILFVAVGCDYCDKLKGIGIMTATRAIQDAFLSDKPSSSSSQSKLGRVLEELYAKCYLGTHGLTKKFKKEYEERFLAAIFMFRHAIVYDPLQGRNVLVSRRRMHHETPALLYMDPELMDHEPYVALCQDFDRIQEIVGTLRSKEFAMKWAQGFGGWRRNSPHEEDEDDRPEQPVENTTVITPVKPRQQELTQEDMQDTDEFQLETQDDTHVFATQEEVTFDKQVNEEHSLARPNDEGGSATQQDGNDPVDDEANTEDDEAMLLTQQDGNIPIVGEANTQGEEAMVQTQEVKNPLEGTAPSSSDDEFFDTQSFIS